MMIGQLDFGRAEYRSCRTCTCHGFAIDLIIMNAVRQRCSCSAYYVQSNSYGSPSLFNPLALTEYGAQIMQNAKCKGRSSQKMDVDFLSRFCHVTITELRRSL